jgi:hypothetical protein
MPKARVLGPGENSAKLPPTYLEASKKKHLNGFFSRQGNWGEGVAYFGEGPYDLAPHKLRGPKKGKAKSEKQKREDADKKPDLNPDMQGLDADVS